MDVQGIDTFVTVVHNGDNSRVEMRTDPIAEPYNVLNSLSEKEADEIGVYFLAFWADRGSMLITV